MIASQAHRESDRSGCLAGNFSKVFNATREFCLEMERAILAARLSP